ncbi:nucleotidyl transferase AbiEii/AbiGii toxin family protein [Holophaga foetida]|uniref:nucleotidyl transferase AbiEii/AbiGii toxin family protein n=1 Tax=Holophaga foetida TaxID=35839 RepID=UPI0011DC8172|nr:nucleotidyl transferase AbiEii/AbiGii toxin family protein [Holophaga foetida]
MALLGLDNSRAKDYFDLWHLAQNHTFEASSLAGAIQATFIRRGTEWPQPVPEGLSAPIFTRQTSCSVG